MKQLILLGLLTMCLGVCVSINKHNIELLNAYREGIYIGRLEGRKESATFIYPEKRSDYLPDNFINSVIE